MAALGDHGTSGGAFKLHKGGGLGDLARPPRGFDFNDLLSGRAPQIEEGAI